MKMHTKTTDRKNEGREIRNDRWLYLQYEGNHRKTKYVSNIL